MAQRLRLFVIPCFGELALSDLATFVGLLEFSQLAGLTRQAAWKACRKGEWHGHRLEVRTIGGRGGRSGLQYQVKVSSLPIELQDSLKDLQRTDEDRSSIRTGEAAQRERNWKFDVIRTALAFPKNSRQRGECLGKLAGEMRLDWRGQPLRLTKSALYRWVETYERDGLQALSRAVYSSKGRKKCWVSLEWHNAVPFGDDVKAAIHEDLKRYVRGLIMGGSQMKQTRVLASEKLKALSAAHGYRVNDRARERIVFSIPFNFVKDEHHYKAVYRRRSDRKAHEDAKPRIRRTVEGLLPMDVVVADVHHANIRLLRDDGTTATAKMIAFFDVATERFFYEFVLFEGRASVRNIDVIGTFVNMCQDKAFGLPKKLYFDNGSEYRFADQLEDALKLGVEFRDLDEVKSVHRAKPYNAAAKRIEGGFRELNQFVQRHIPGWIDDDRMKPKGRELGKAHRPYEGGFDAFCAEFRQLMQAYAYMPKTGALKGKSPAERFGNFVADGWRANVLDPMDLLTVFTKPETRTVRKHGIEADGRVWSCDGLRQFFGNKVQVHIPRYGFGFNMLKIFDMQGREIGVAVPDQEYSYFDPRGAQESARRTAIREKALTQLSKSEPPIDVKAELIEYGGKQLPVIPNEPDGVVSVGAGRGETSLAIRPAMTKRKTQQQIEDEVRKQDEARSLFMSMVAAGSKR